METATDATVVDVKSFLNKGEFMIIMGLCSTAQIRIGLGESKFTPI